MNINIEKSLDTNLETNVITESMEKNKNSTKKEFLNQSNISYSSKYKILSQKKNTPKQINISSFESPEQKVIYFNESENSSHLKYEMEKLPNYRISFLIEQIGENKVNKLLNLIEKSSDPVKLLNGDGREIQEIVGGSYKKVQNFLKNFILPVNSI